MPPPTILIVADDPGFARDLVARWQVERVMPAFTILASSMDSVPGEYDVAVVGPMPPERALAVLRVLEHRDAPIVCLVETAAAAAAVRAAHARPVVIRKHETWLDSVVLVAVETLRRVEVAARLRRSECVIAEQQRQAALGEYMLQNRHSFNNALTSVMGNAELLLLDPASLSEPVHDQINTIHNMALRLHEIMQRFSSLETEINFAQKNSPKDLVVMARSAGSVR